MIMRVSVQFNYGFESKLQETFSFISSASVYYFISTFGLIKKVACINLVLQMSQYLKLQVGLSKRFSVGMIFQ